MQINNKFKKHIYLLSLFLLVSLFILTGYKENSPPNAIISPSCHIIGQHPFRVSCSYTSTAMTYPTSEGGAWEHVDILHTSPNQLKAIYDKGFRIVHSYICLSDYHVPSSKCPATYVPAPLTLGFLENFQEALDNVRSAGLKVILRFTYNNPSPSNPPVQGGEDAPMSTILGHMNQLAPFIIANEDVIYTLQTGFIGRWGEWHNSTNSNDTTAEHNIFFDEFFRLFGHTQLSLETRYPSDVLDYLTYSHQDSPIIGIHDDALASDDTDGGTFVSHSDTTHYTEAQLRNFTIENGQNFTFNGETGAVYPALQNCQSFLSYAAQYHLSGLDVVFDPNVINYWIAQGCYNRIVSHVGPRLVLINSQLIISDGYKNIQLMLGLKNEGFSRVISKRPAYLVISHIYNSNGLSNTTPVAMQQLNLNINQIDAGETINWSEKMQLNKALSAGTYTAALWLPDANARLQQYVSYNLLLNNVGVPDLKTGLNTLIKFNLP